MARRSVNEPLDRFQKIEFLAKGCFGEVFKAIDRKTNTEVAMKRIFRKNTKRPNADMDKCIRGEISALSKLNHENVIKLYGYLEHADCGGVDLVLDLCDADLSTFLKKEKQAFMTRRKRRIISKQIFTGIQAIHKQGILHRDLKPANILLTKDLGVKIADFGCCKTSQRESLCRPVGSRPYMAPEVLLEVEHGKAMDIWSGGVITAELWLTTNLFRSVDKEDLLDKIMSVCGSITEENWPGVSKSLVFASLDLYPYYSRCFPTWFQAVTKNDRAIDLLDQIFVLNPSKRIKIEEILKHDFFLSNIDVFYMNKKKEEPEPLNYAAALKKNLNGNNQVNAKRPEGQSPSSTVLGCAASKPDQEAKRASLPKGDIVKTRNIMDGVQNKTVPRQTQKPLDTIPESQMEPVDVTGHGEEDPVNRSIKEAASIPEKEENQNHFPGKPCSASGNTKPVQPTYRRRGRLSQRKRYKVLKPSKAAKVLSSIPEETSISSPGSHTPQQSSQRVASDHNATPQNRRLA